MKSVWMCSSIGPIPCCNFGLLDAYCACTYLLYVYAYVYMYVHTYVHMCVFTFIRTLTIHATFLLLLLLHTEGGSLVQLLGSMYLCLISRSSLMVRSCCRKRVVCVCTVVNGCCSTPASVFIQVLSAQRRS